MEVATFLLSAASCKGGAKTLVRLGFVSSQNFKYLEIP